MNAGRYNRTMCALVVVIAVSVVMSRRVVAAPDDTGPVPTMAELRQMYDAEQYRVCLHQIGRAMRLGPAKNYDKYALLLLRGDCLLRLEDPATAALAYKAAMASPLPAQAQEGRATALLIARSTKMTYVPRDGGSDGINIGKPENRRKAMAALLQDELRSDKSAIDRAVGAENLVPIMDALPVLTDLYALERTATGGDGQTRPILQAIGERARILIGSELEAQDRRVSSVEQRANQMIDTPGVAGGHAWWWSGSTRRGLWTDDRNELRDLGKYVARIVEASKLGRQAAVAFDGNPKLWDPLIERAKEVAEHAQSVLDAE